MSFSEPEDPIAPFRASSHPRRVVDRPKNTRIPLYRSNATHQNKLRASRHYTAAPKFCPQRGRHHEDPTDFVLVWGRHLAHLTLVLTSICADIWPKIGRFLSSGGPTYGRTFRGPAIFLSYSHPPTEIHKDLLAVHAR